MKQLVEHCLTFSLREAVKNYLADFFRSPLTENHFAKKPLAEMGGTPPPITGKSAKLFRNKVPKRATIVVLIPKAPGPP